MSNYNEKYHIPKTIESNKIFGIEREEFFLIFSLFFFSLFLESFVFLLISVGLVFWYFSYKGDKKNFIQSIKYKKLYDFVGLKSLVKPFVKKIF